MNKRTVLAVAVIAEIVLLSTASAIFAGYFSPKQQTPRSFVPAEYAPLSQTLTPVPVLSTLSPSNSPDSTSQSSSSQLQTSPSQTSSSTSPPSTSPTPQLSSEPLQTSQTASTSPEASQTPSTPTSQSDSTDIFDVSLAYAYAGPTNATGTPNPFGFPNMTLNPSSLYPALVYLNFTLLPMTETPACDYRFEAYLIQITSDKQTSETYVYYEGTNFYAASPNTLPNPTVNDLTNAGPQTGIRPGAEMYLNWTPGLSTLGRITDSGSYQSGQSGLGLWSNGQPNTITVKVTWLGSISYTGNYAQSAPSNNETVAQVELAKFGAGFLYNTMVPQDQLSQMDPLNPPTPKPSAAPNPSPSYPPAPSPTPKPTPSPGTVPMFNVNVAYAYVGARNDSLTSPNQPWGGTSASNASSMYPNVGYLTFASTGSQSCDAKIEVYLIQFSSDTGVNQSYVYAMGANYTSSYDTSRVQGMDADVNDFVEMGPNSSMMVDNGISVQNNFNASLVTGSPFLGASVGDFGWYHSGPSGLGIWANGQPNAVTLTVYRLGWVTLKGQSISVDFANPNDVAVQVQLSKFGNGFLYNTIFSPDELGQINLCNPPILRSQAPN